MISQVCMNCNQDFQASPSRRRKFCSRNCYFEYQTKNDKWKWGQGRSRVDGWQDRLSSTRKKLFAEGKLTSPTLGIKRPDVAQRNKECTHLYRGHPVRRYTNDFVTALYLKYKTFHGGLRAFAKLNDCSTSPLREAFHRIIPAAELDLTMEDKKGHNNKYALGRNFEWRVRDYYKSIGYWVLRSPRSGGPVDLVAIRKGEVLLIQCKVHGEMLKKEKFELSYLADSIGAIALLVWRGLPPRYPLQFEQISKVVLKA